MYAFALGQSSIIIRAMLQNSSTGAPLAGLSSSSSGLIISTIADNEAAATAYTVAGSTIQTIATLGTYAAPSASNCRFSQVDATNHPGLYEMQFANARFSVSGSKSLIITWSGASSLLANSLHVPLRQLDPYNTAAIFTAATIAESYATVNTAGTPAQLLYLIQQLLSNIGFSGTSNTITKQDGTTTAAVLTLDSSSSPTTSKRTS